MKYKNSSIPYLFLLVGILIGLPLFDAKVENDLSLDYKVKPKLVENCDNKNLEKPQKWLVHATCFSNQN